jgi:hypothetical protein
VGLAERASLLACLDQATAAGQQARVVAVPPTYLSKNKIVTAGASWRPE